MNKRVIQTAGSGSITLLAPPLPSMPDFLDGTSTVSRLIHIITQEIKKQFSLKNNFKNASKVFVAPEVKKILLPTQMASISSTKKSIGRGSQVTLFLDGLDKDKEILRLFVHWIGRDIDLSAMLINSDFTETKQVSFTNLKSRAIVVHSGDIVNVPQPDGASEFIDINI